MKVFKSIPDAFRTVEHSLHKLSGACLLVSLIEELEDENPDDFEGNEKEKVKGTSEVAAMHNYNYCRK